MCHTCGDARSGEIPGTSWFLFRKAVPLLHLSRSLPNCCRQIHQSILYSHWLSDLSLGFLSLLWSMKAHSFLFSSGSFKATDTVWSSVVLTDHSPLRSLKRKKKKQISLWSLKPSLKLTSDSVDLKKDPWVVTSVINLILPEFFSQFPTASQL